MQWRKLLLSLGGPIVVGGVGGLVTAPSIASWYAYLDKPWFSPPNWVFGPVWTILYLLMGTSLYLAWTAPVSQLRKWGLIAFSVQLGLNLLWSVAFFGLRLPWLGVVVILLLLAAIGVTMRLFYVVNRTSFYLLTPYAAWTAFATLLNLAVARLN